jgi:iron complex outermembrane receptor protein
MKKGKESFLLAGVVAASLAVALIVNFSSAPVAAAQEEKPKQETAREEKVRGEYELGTMTVTSQKREENVQDVPMSISVFSDIQLEDAGIKDISDLVRFAPNVY